MVRKRRIDGPSSGSEGSEGQQRTSPPQQQTEVEQDLEQLAIQSDETPAPPPQSSLIFGTFLSDETPAPPPQTFQSDETPAPPPPQLPLIFGTFLSDETPAPPPQTFQSDETPAPPPQSSLIFGTFLSDETPAPPPPQLPLIFGIGTIDYGGGRGSYGGGGRGRQSRQPSCPELHQATHSEASSSQPPKAIKEKQPPPRPGLGRNGRKTLVKANHFSVELSKKDVYQYDVKITPKATSRRVNPEDVSRSVMRKLGEQHRASRLGTRLPAYDGRIHIYTAGSLPYSPYNLTITLDDGSGEQRKFDVAIGSERAADLGLFLEGKQTDLSQHGLHILDTVLRQHPTSRYYPVGRSFYSPDLGKTSLGEGLESWRGFHQSLRPTQMGLSLNIDVSSTTFIEQLSVIDFVTKLLKWKAPPLHLSRADKVKIQEALIGIKVGVTHRPNHRKYRIVGLTSEATSELSVIENESGKEMPLVDYFKKLNYQIIYTKWPCFRAGKRENPNYLPMEVCKIMECQRYTKPLNERLGALLKVAGQHRPFERENAIRKTVNTNDYCRDAHAQEFGININDSLEVVEARILPAPMLRYNVTGGEKTCLPKFGRWDMTKKKMFNGGSVKNWLCVNFSSNVEIRAADGFCSEIARVCKEYGMVFNLRPVVPVITAQRDQVKNILKKQYDVAKSMLLEDEEINLLIVILPDNKGPLYGDIKRICDTEVGVVTQCCLSKNVFTKNKQYYVNVALKINVKVGGRNTVLVDALSRSLPVVSEKLTIIFGADVSHGEDSSPSIAAVVASQDWPEMTKYAGLVCAQQPREEIIQDLFKQWQDPVEGTLTGGMIKDLLTSFSKVNEGIFPHRIIFYRDGVGEGQFSQVLLHELEAIYLACASINPGYKPDVTFVVVQKRHHTRLFANDHGDKRCVDASGNILPGTVVDSRICHGSEFDFYLCSHAGAIGTSRPAHYHVLWDDNNFSADDLQSLTNNLCYTYARCTRSVSIVPPVYYAHLAASRARFYVEPETRGGAGEAAGPSTHAPGADAAVRPLPALKDKVKKVMFYC